MNLTTHEFNEREGGERHSNLEGFAAEFRGRVLVGRHPRLPRVGNGERVARLLGERRRRTDFGF